MANIFRFLLKLAADGFYGDVRIHFKAGVPSFPVEVQQTYMAADLPEPDPACPKYQQALVGALDGVSFPPRA